MKRLLLTLALLCGMTVCCMAQDPYEDMSHEYIPQYFMDGAFLYPVLLVDLVDDFNEFDPINSSLMYTYAQLSSVMLGLKIGTDRIEDNLSRIEEHLGCDNAIYGLALIPKAVSEDEDLEILLESADIIAETAGEDSWEYALVMYFCSNVTLDIEKYGDSKKSLEYIERSMEILEAGYKDMWLYSLAKTSKGAAKLFAEDASGFNDVVQAFESITEVTEQNFFTYLRIGIDLSTLYTNLGYHDYSIQLAEQLEPLLMENELVESEMYIAVNRTMCYAYAMKKNSRKAREYFEKAEKACIARFGEGSEQHKGLQKYREMF